MTDMTVKKARYYQLALDERAAPVRFGEGTVA